MGVFKDRHCLFTVFRRGGQSALVDSIESNVLATDSFAEHRPNIVFCSFLWALLLLTLELIVVDIALSIKALVNSIGMSLHAAYYYGKEAEEGDYDADNDDIDHLSALGLIHLTFNDVFSKCRLHLCLVLTNAFLSDGITKG